ncbi:radical SAM additional 4Fe4S-binding SPASM domain-containing protein [Paenibacillus sophorae]|uniref:Radical SAM additional 4Fe4S-binding SPASM domain-containing protein n=1 Tax=Paenibacillus sophorae TaxID=1333845 RepID=A0A1H8UG07_9BACL|nr:radical SAM protein [Paenibacillus sophorae]QWU13145.1 radical SAM protein [Paenibacillus sophorae]SEP02026.1 radical SAM additional 4Fe4S-binding SPASM domain-containing protein [Paenibacillus sophorae]
MQPKSSVVIDEGSFEVMKRTMRNMAVPYRERLKNPKYRTPVPESVGIKLTNRCNLRCIHCFQWNEDGYHHAMDKEEQNKDIDLDVFRKIMEETSEAKSRLYIWGGEPMFHKQFDQILEMLAADPREMTICSNGLLIDKYLDGIIRISPGLELLIAVEGLEAENDFIRGKGTFAKTMKQIERLVELREQGIYKGRISVHSMINDAMIPKLYELLEYFESLKLDLVILCFPWYISKETSKQMDAYFMEKFSWLRKLHENQVNSWHAFKYQMNPEHVDSLVKALERINERVWNIRVRYQPGLDYDEIEQFVRGEAMTSRCATTCMALSTRMDVMPTGDVSACKFFAEFTVGNLKHQGTQEVWDSDNFDRVREIINVEGLTPACSKCSVLHLHGI